MAVPFILLATQRTGSTWVQDTLNTHPELKVYTELFIGGSTGTPLWEPSDLEFIDTYWETHARRPRRITRHYWTVRYLQRVFDRRECAAVGFKYMYDQIRRSPPVLPYAAARRMRVVHLIRRNLLDVVISNQRALHTGVFHLPADGRPQIPWAPAELDRSRIHLDPAHVVGELQRLERERRLARAWLRATRTPTLEVEYEALHADPGRFAGILSFLGVQAVELTSGLKKIGTEPRGSVVENLPELEAALAGTRFAPFLAAA